MKILVTGAAGFIGMHTILAQIKQNHEIVGIDNINDYYDVELKLARLKECGIVGNCNQKTTSSRYKNYTFIKSDISDRNFLENLFMEEKFDVVCHMAAQAGVRYSIVNPYVYIDSNISGFLNILECCRHFQPCHFVYASSSSIYGLSDSMPLTTDMPANNPISLYAATKKSNELMAHAYSHLYNIPTTGLRFFTVYGPWGRPDMAPFIFTKAIFEQKPIKIFNNGNMKRDFTYIDDIVNGVCAVLNSPPQKSCNIYNIGASAPVSLMDFISEIEKAAEKMAVKEMHAMQPGDVVETYADVSGLAKDYDYRPSVGIEEGVARFVKWYKSVY